MVRITGTSSHSSRESPRIRGGRSGPPSILVHRASVASVSGRMSLARTGRRPQMMRHLKLNSNFKQQACHTEQMPALDRKVLEVAFARRTPGWRGGGLWG